MKNINYKYVSLMLAFVLIVTYSWHWNDIFFHKNNEMKMSMGNVMGEMLSNMKGESGTELEKTFLREMIAHHEGAVIMSRELLKDKSISNPELIRFANDIITNQSKEIEMQEGWLEKWYAK